MCACLCERCGRLWFWLTHPHAADCCLLQVIDGVVTDRFLRNWLDLLSFLLAGLPADGVIAAEVGTQGLCCKACCG